MEPQPAQIGSIHVPETAERHKTGHEGALGGRMLYGLVLAVGPGKVAKNGRLFPVDVAVGDRVLVYYIAELDRMEWEGCSIVSEDYLQGVIS
jgi:co-chaperonin GroES (HSP10)